MLRRGSSAFWKSVGIFADNGGGGKVALGNLAGDVSVKSESGYT
jgi:hypothetical protein